MGGTLYVVATPIGNMGDMTARGTEVLSSVDIIAAEDTRTSGVLLEKLGIGGQKLVAYHKFNEEAGASGLIRLLQEGKNVAVITDAGTPCVSDPGSVLVSAAVQAGVNVTAVPGASAVCAAISVSGFNTVAFSFFGFLPRKDGELAEVFERIKGEYSKVSVFYESPRRIKDSLKVMKKVIPEARLCLCNDLTKKFERIYRGSPSEVLEELDGNPDYSKGEYALVVSLPEYEKEEKIPAQSTPELALLALVLEGVTVRDAAAELISKGEFPKNEIKRAAIKIKERFEID
ncbi:MAG: 16S rRNA (cytidine(1402)-2'-O)-methyltransferase [Clostridia bacterium]|nr:16S rRNA (cytidine(1402)-2'-O)-methyltransferase [Clostridia bacterium]